MAGRERESEDGRVRLSAVYTAEELREALMRILDKAGSAYKLRGDALITELIPGVELVLRGAWCYIHVNGVAIAASECEKFDGVYSKTLMNLVQCLLVEAVGPDSDDFESFAVSVDENTGGLIPAPTLDYMGLPVWDFSASGLPTAEQLRVEIRRTRGLADMLRRGPDA